MTEDRKSHLWTLLTELAQLGVRRRTDQELKGVMREAASDALERSTADRATELQAAMDSAITDARERSQRDQAVDDAAVCEVAVAMARAMRLAAVPAGYLDAARRGLAEARVAFEGNVCMHPKRTDDGVLHAHWYAHGPHCPCAHQAGRRRIGFAR